MIQLIEGHKQRTHLAIQPLQQEAAHIFRHLEAAQFEQLIQGEYRQWGAIIPKIPKRAN